MESAVPVLAENTTFIDLKPGKPTGLGMTQLGIPVLDGTVVKKGKLHEFIQLTNDDKPGRRYQNIRITAVKTGEGGIESAKVFVQFEVFGDDNVPEAPGSAAFSVAKAKSSHGSSASTLAVSTVEPVQMRRPVGASR